jgi:hypothetical protein
VLMSCLKLLLGVLMSCVKLLLGVFMSCVKLHLGVFMSCVKLHLGVLMSCVKLHLGVFMSCLCCFCLLTYGFRNVLCCVVLCCVVLCCVMFFFVLCALCCQFLWIVHFRLPHSVTFIQRFNISMYVIALFK